MREKHTIFFRNLNCFKNFSNFISAISACVSSSKFASVISVPVSIMSSAVVLKICPISAGIKKVWVNYQEKKKESINHIVLLAKAKWNIFIVLIYSINHDKFVSLNNVLIEYNEMKEEVKNPKIAIEFTISKQWKLIVPLVKKYWEQTF